MLFFISSTFISKHKNYANAEQHPEAEFAVFEKDSSRSSSPLSSKNDKVYSEMLNKTNMSVFMRLYD